MFFDPTSEFEIIKVKKKVSKKFLDDFWADVDYYYEGVPDAIGVFIFSIRTSRGRMPWYVGKSDKNGFINDCFSKKKLSLYNEALKIQKGTPYITFIPAYTKSGRFVRARKNPNATVNALQKLIIGAALKKNKELINVKKKGALSNIVLPGYVNTPRGRAKWEVVDFRKLIGV